MDCLGLLPSEIKENSVFRDGIGDGLDLGTHNCGFGELSRSCLDSRNHCFESDISLNDVGNGESGNKLNGHCGC